MAYNPRFPNTLKLIRAVLDENGEPVLDENANPVYKTVPLLVAEYDGGIPRRKTVWVASDTLLLGEEDSLVVTEDGKTIVAEKSQVAKSVPVVRTRLSVPYGYRQQTANATLNGDVIIAEMKIACPLIIGEMNTKDLLELTDSDRTFRAEVVKKVTGNFGTNIWYNEVKQ